MNCTCPKRANEQGIVERVGLDIRCPTHGDPAFKPEQSQQSLREAGEGKL